MSVSSSTISSDLVGEAPARPEAGSGARRFALALAVCVLTVLQSVAAVNIAVDPFGYFGFNQVGFHFNSEREFKQRQIDIYPHRGLLLGNSKMAYVDPDLIEGYDFFNAAFSAAKPEEVLKFLEAHAAGNEYVALAIDHRVFLRYDERELELVERRWSDWLRYSLSLELLDKSFEALGLWLLGTPSLYKQNGARTTAELEARDYLTEGIGYWDRLDEREDEYSRITPVFEPERLEQFRRMKQILDRHGIAHVVFMSPLNIHEQGAIGWKKYWASNPNYLALVEDLRSIFPEFRDYSDSRYSGAENFWPTDFKHYRPEVGAEIIRAMLAEQGIGPAAD